jgi:hypothetical protein
VWRALFFAHFRSLVFSWPHGNDGPMMADIEQAAAADIRTSVFVCSTSRVFGDGEMGGRCNPVFLFTRCEQTT